MAFFAIIIMAALKTIPQDMYEAAAIDGAGPLKKFFYITLPSIRVILLLMVLLRAVQTINCLLYTSSFFLKTVEKYLGLRWKYSASISMEMGSR